jgi:hypothetical protein
MDLPKISEEQKIIIDYIKTCNVQVQAVAGSGKTTCNLYIAKKYPKDNILLLTYNKKLKSETRNKIQTLGLTNIEAHSYHSFCVKYYKRDCFTDYEIKTVLDDNIEPLVSSSYQILVIDEAQDLTPRYFSLIHKIFKDTCSAKTRICIMGDKYQSIYDFNKADSRFLSFAPQIMKFSKREWKTASLSESFRLTNQMSKFINRVLYNNSADHQIVTHRSGLPVLYNKCNCFAPKWRKPYRPAIILQHFLARKYKPDDIFVLSPSVSNKSSPVRTFANFVSQKLHIPIYVPVNDNDKLNEEVLIGKLVFSTYHQAKGLERKIVFVFGFDDSYFRYYKKNAPQDECPNEIYVACTRAINQLVLFNHIENDILPFMSPIDLFETCDVTGNPTIGSIVVESGDPMKIEVTKLIKYLSCDTIEKALKNTTLQTVGKPKYNIKIPIITGEDAKEEVSEITGTAIPAYYELKRMDSMTIAEQIGENPTKNITTPDLLKLSTNYCAKMSGYNFKKNQITSYDWLSQENLDLCAKKMDTLDICNKNPHFEKPIEITNTTTGNRKIVGRLDYVDDESFYEFKCTQEIKKEHILQTCIYMYMLREQINEKRIEYIKNNTIREFKSGDVVMLNFKKYAQIISQEPLKIRFGATSRIIKKDEILCLKSLILPEFKKAQRFFPFQKPYIFNILTGERLTILCKLDDLRTMIKLLITEKYKHETKKTQDFIKMAKQLLEGNTELVEKYEEKKEEPEEQVSKSDIDDFNNI